MNDKKLNLGHPDLQFSLIEALFARGFTDMQSVQEILQPDFQEALTGTIAYSHAVDIYLKAVSIAPHINLTKIEFKPINPDGSLTNCIPPMHLSPLGPVEYLHEMLKASEVSTCDDPMPEDVEGTLGDLIANRRGPLGDLHVTQANLETPLPLIDLVNENLEALVAGLPGATEGVVYDTSGDELAGHKLRIGDTQSGSGTGGENHFTVYGRIPEGQNVSVGSYSDSLTVTVEW